jgi:hypothetical protein
MHSFAKGGKFRVGPIAFEKIVAIEDFCYWCSGFKRNLAKGFHRKIMIAT